MASFAQPSPMPPPEIRAQQQVPEISIDAGAPTQPVVPDVLIRLRGKVFQLDEVLRDINGLLQYVDRGLTPMLLPFAELAEGLRQEVEKKVAEASPGQGMPGAVRPGVNPSMGLPAGTPEMLPVPPGR